MASVLLLMPRSVCVCRVSVSVCLSVSVDPDEIVKWAINGALKGDTQFLDKKLEQLHMIEFSVKYRFG